MIQRTAKAIWNGTLPAGSGQLTTQSGVLKSSPYTFKSRFGGDPQTNPEELIAAAHAGCFSMALAHDLEASGIPPESIETEAQVTLKQEGKAWTISQVNLKVRAKVPGAARAGFMASADRAKENCPVSKLLKAQIEMDAELIEESVSPGMTRSEGEGRSSATGSSGGGEKDLPPAEGGQFTG